MSNGLKNMCTLVSSALQQEGIFEKQFKVVNLVQSNFNSSNVFETKEI